jgi:hypothetical protein
VYVDLLFSEDFVDPDAVYVLSYCDATCEYDIDVTCTDELTLMLDD